MFILLDIYDQCIFVLLQEEFLFFIVEIVECIGFFQLFCWWCIQCLKEEGVICKQVILFDCKKIGLNIQVFVQIKFNVYGCKNFIDFVEVMYQFFEVLECYVLMGVVDFMLCIVICDIEFYECFFFEKLLVVLGIQEVNFIVVLLEIKFIIILFLFVF